jgi:hypothetical protein
VAYTVSQTTKEIGIRMPLGATPSCSVRKFVVDVTQDPEHLETLAADTRQASHAQPYHPSLLLTFKIAR